MNSSNALDVALPITYYIFLHHVPKWEQTPFVPNVPIWEHRSFTKHFYLNTIEFYMHIWHNSSYTMLHLNHIYILKILIPLPYMQMRNQTQPNVDKNPQL